MRHRCNCHGDSLYTPFFILEKGQIRRKLPYYKYTKTIKIFNYILVDLRLQ